MTRIMIPLVISTTLLTACGGSSGGPETPPNDPPPGPDLGPNPVLGPDTDQLLQYVTPEGTTVCSIDDIKGRVGFDMLDYYIYYDQVPPLDPTQFATPEELIRALRVNPDIYSNVTDEQEQGALFDDGVTSGYGFTFSPASDGVVRFREILHGSPADDAEIVRGDELIRLNGQLISDYTNDEIRNTLAEDQPPITLQIREADGTVRGIELEQRAFSWGTVSYDFFRADELPTVGLLEVRSFLGTTSDEIDASINGLLEEGIDELIIDLRYNPGGFIRVAERLAAQIAGPSVNGQPFLTSNWNDKYSENNSTSSLVAAVPTFTFPRVFVLMTGRSASASEAMVNGLEPYMDVIIIGSATGGKIFTSNARSYCGRSINAMRSVRVNSVGVSVLGGIQPDCPVIDDWTTLAHSVNDPLTSAALDFIVTGSCPAPAIAARTNFNRNGSAGLSFDGLSELRNTPLDLVD